MTEWVRNCSSLSAADFVTTLFKLRSRNAISPILNTINL